MNLSGEVLARLADEVGLEQPSIVVRGLGIAMCEATLAPDLALYPASMIKVPIAFALEAARERGELGLDDRVTVATANMTANDAPSPFRPGYRARLAECGRAMLANSDNVATNVLIDHLGRSEINETCRALGLANTSVRRKLSGSLPLIDDPEATGRNTHPAGDAANLFGRLARANRPQWICDALAEQMWNGKLAAGLMANDRFAHKTGDTDEVSHDGGLLKIGRGDRTYVLVVYTGLAATPQTDARLAAFARALRPYLAA